MDRSFQFPQPERQYETFIVSLSDMTTALTTGTAKAQFYAPFPMKVFSVSVQVATAPTTSGITVNIKNGGTGIFTVKPTIDATKFTSQTSTTPPLIYAPFIALNALLTFDIDAIGSGTAGAGLQVQMLCYRT